MINVCVSVCLFANSYNAKGKYKLFIKKTLSILKCYHSGVPSVCRLKSCESASLNFNFIISTKAYCGQSNERVSNCVAIQGRHLTKLILLDPLSPVRASLWHLSPRTSISFPLLACRLSDMSGTKAVSYAHAFYSKL